MANLAWVSIEKNKKVKLKMKSKTMVVSKLFGTLMRVLKDEILMPPSFKIKVDSIKIHFIARF